MRCEKRGSGDRTLLRGGTEIGNLIGPKSDSLVTFETLIGDPLLTFIADKPETWTVNGKRPIAVYRKSKPIDWRMPNGDFVMRHVIFLKTDGPIAANAVTIGITALNVDKTSVLLAASRESVRSDSIHVQQIGFRPDDPVKRAFLSLWLGTGGGYNFPDNMTFRIVDNRSGKSVYSGKVVKVLDKDAKERLQREDNFSATSVYKMDFSDFKTPGNYSVVVDGVGRSYPFPIAGNVWDTAFRVQMRGLANERSGVALAPPYADYTRPRDFHPADGAPVFESSYSRLDGPTEGPGIEKGSTGKLLPDAWGGYHDAGDWNPRRVTHMEVTAAQLEMLRLFPAHFEKMVLPIPHKSGIPDVLTEALFELDCFRRLQKTDGGMPFGIETNGDPIAGEVSFKQSMPAYVYAPDLWSSYFYAGVAARAAKLLQKYNAPLAKTYRDSALKAMAWAEQDWHKREKDGTLTKLDWAVKDDRNLAAVLLYDLTGDTAWHTLFKENTVLKEANANLFAYGTAVQQNAAFAYTFLPASLLTRR